MNIIYDKELTIGDIEKLIYEGAKLELSEEAVMRIEKSYGFLERFEKNKVIYGINTGFGPMAQYRVDDDSLNELQYNIIRSHDRTRMLDGRRKRNSIFDADDAARFHSSKHQSGAQG